MKELIWKAIAAVVSKPRVADAIIRYAKRTPYLHLPTNEHPSYMERYWVFNPYSRVTNKPRWGWLCPWSIRVHHIKREDYDRAYHDHPWDARTIILRGWYIESRPARTGSWGAPDEFGRREWLADEVLYVRRQGDTATLGFNEYHTIRDVSDGGVYTLFISGKWKGVWGFWCSGVETAPRDAYCLGHKVPWKKYLGME